jgi:hypothetical protein
LKPSIKTVVAKDVATTRELARGVIQYILGCIGGVGRREECDALFLFIFLVRDGRVAR